MMKRASKLNNVAIVVCGLLAFVCSLVLVWGGGVQGEEYERWEAALLLQDAAELRTVGVQSDGVVVGSVDPETPASAEGLAMYEYWKMEIRGSGRSRRRVTEHVPAYDYKPGFRLLFDGQEVTVQSERAYFRDTQDIMVGGDVWHHGFAPGDGVTVFGTVLSAGEVQADVICGGNREECLEGFSKQTLVTFIIAAILILVGGGLIWLGIARLRKP
jgi:hypothetical protein